MSDEPRILHEWRGLRGSYHIVPGSYDNPLLLNEYRVYPEVSEGYNETVHEIVRLAERVRELERLVPISALERVEPTEE